MGPYLKRPKFCVWSDAKSRFSTKRAQLDWDAIDPAFSAPCSSAVSIRTNGASLGAHYTSREDIETLVEPVVMWPPAARMGRPAARGGGRQPEEPRTIHQRRAALYRRDGQEAQDSGRSTLFGSFWGD